MGEDNQNTNQNANTGANNESVGAETKPTTFDDFLKEKENQAEFDRRVQKAIETAKGKWQEINDAEKTEAEKLAKMNKEQKLEYEVQKANKEKDNANAELNAYKLKEQALTIASEKGLDVSLLNLIDFKSITAEKLNESIDNLSNVFNKAVEKAVNAKLKEDTPITKTNNNAPRKEIPRASF
jgi:hypothetical protein